MIRPILRNVTCLVATCIAAHGAAESEHAHHAGHGQQHVVDITAEDYAFRAPAEIPSGWTTFRFENAGEETHLLFIGRLPDGITFDDYATGVVAPFSDVWYRLRDGEIASDEMFPELFENLAPWFAEMPFMGGVGYLEPGRVAEATIHLEPGNYVIECYMRTPDGEMHNMEGMMDPLTVTDARSQGAPPTSDFQITLSERGMEMDRSVPSGRRTFEVHYVDHPAGTFGHDVQVVRLDGNADAAQVMYWLDPTNVEALTDPAPGTFVGGINQLPEGSTGYFTVELAPGRYLFVSEFTGPMGVREEVTVEE